MENAATHPQGIEDYAAFLNTLPDAALLVDARGRILLVNSAAQSFFGYGPDELQGQHIDVLVPESLSDAHVHHVEGYLSEPQRRAMGSGLTLHARHASGKDLPVDIMLGPISMAGEACTLCIVRDIAERIGLENDLAAALAREQQLARTDPVTGGANSRLFRERAQLEIERARRYPHPFAIAYIDLDNFKAINDTLGHATGDRVLGCVAERMRNECRRTDTVARLGGDEFAILFPEADAVAARVVANKIRNALLETMRGNDWAITFSIGVLTCTEPPDSAEELIHAVDEIMYSVKAAGKDAVRVAHWPPDVSGP